jgi:hypothetical protein
MDCVNDHLVVAVTDRSMAFSNLSPRNGNLGKRQVVALPPKRRTPKGVIDTIGDWMQATDAEFNRIWITCADPALRQGLAVVLNTAVDPPWLDRVALQSGASPAARDMPQDGVAGAKNRRSAIALVGAAIAGAAAASVASSSVRGLASKGSAPESAPPIGSPIDRSPPGQTATPPAAATPGVAAAGGVVQMDSFAGANDDAKLAAAMGHAAAQTNIPAIQLPARAMTFNTGGLTPYSGMRIIAPFGADGPKSPELAGGKYANHQVILNVGAGARSWFNGTATYYDIYIGDIAFTNPGRNGQFWNQLDSATLYGCQFHGLSFYGFKYILGNPSVPCAVTQVSFTGHWEVVAFTNTAFTLVGSDNDFWFTGYLNISTGDAAPSSGTPIISMPIMEKTNIGYTYITASPGWVGASFGGGGHTCSWYGPTFEGLSGTPATYPLLNVGGGYLTIYGGRFHYLKPASGVNGVITQSGGQLTLDSPTWDNSSYRDAFPFVYQTAGHCCLINPVGVNGGNAISFRQSGGNTVTAPPGAITYN